MPDCNGSTFRRMLVRFWTGSRKPMGTSGDNRIGRSLSRSAVSNRMAASAALVDAAEFHSRLTAETTTMVTPRRATTALPTHAKRRFRTSCNHLTSAPRSTLPTTSSHGSVAVGCNPAQFGEHSMNLSIPVDFHFTTSLWQESSTRQFGDKTSGQSLRAARRKMRTIGAIKVLVM